MDSEWNYSRTGFTGFFEQDLSTVSCFAAIELDNMILERSMGLLYVTKLVELLRESFESFGTLENSPCLLNPTTTVMIFNTLNKIENSSSHTENEIINKTKEIQEKLRLLIDDQNKRQPNFKENLQYLRNFCIELSKYSSNQNISLLSNQDSKSF